VNHYEWEIRRRLMNAGLTDASIDKEIKHMHDGTVSARTCPGLKALGIMNFLEQPDDFSEPVCTGFARGPGDEIKVAPLKDSGKREEFSTGSRRDDRTGKGRFDLLFMGMPEALRRLAVLLERGAAKYGERNWEKGQPISRYIDSAVRHLHRAAQGYKDEDHLVQAAWNCLAAVETLHRIDAEERGAGKGLPSELNDVYSTPDVEPK
jgi:dATP/dGTP diphosphohydrolase